MRAIPIVLALSLAASTATAIDSQAMEEAAQVIQRALPNSITHQVDIEVQLNDLP